MLRYILQRNAILYVSWENNLLRFPPERARIPLIKIRLTS